MEVSNIVEAEESKTVKVKGQNIDHVHQRKGRRLQRVLATWSDDQSARLQGAPVVKVLLSTRKETRVVAGQIMAA